MEKDTGTVSYLPRRTAETRGRPGIGPRFQFRVSREMRAAIDAIAASLTTEERVVTAAMVARSLLAKQLNAECGTRFSTEVL